MAPTTTPAFRRDKDYNGFKRLPVHTVRVVAHSLGVQTRDAKSENHLSVYLLLGQNRSYHMDMQLAVDTTRSAATTTVVNTVGQLVTKGRPYLMSNSGIKYTDLAAIRGQDGTGVHTVEHFVDRVLAHKLQYFRFTFTDGHAVGCRSWVFAVADILKRDGLLSPAVDLRTINPSLSDPSLLQLINNRWDVNRPPLSQLAIPGLLMGQPASDTTLDEAVELLSGASVTAIARLCAALQPRDREFSDGSSVIERAKRTIVQALQFLRTNPSNTDARKKALENSKSSIRMIAEIATSIGFEASQAYDTMFAQESYLLVLVNSIRGKYTSAVDALEAATPLVQQYRQTRDTRHEPELFTLLLAAVVDLSGTEDAGDSDDGDDDDGDDDEDDDDEDDDDEDDDSE